MRLTQACRFLVAAGVALAGLGAACRREPPPEPLDVPFAGCAAIRGISEITCDLGDVRTLRLVVPDGAEGVAIVAGGAALTSRVEVVHGGKRHIVDVPKGTADVTVTARVGGKPARFVLRVAEARKIPWLEEARAARARGDVAAARALASAHLEDVGLDGSGAFAAGLLGRLELAAGRADAAFPLLRRSSERHGATGHLSDMADDGFALAFALHQRSHRYAEAREVLDRVALVLDRYPEGRAREPYYRGILASETGDRRAALALLREAERRARALAMTRLERNARAALALEMQVLGRARASLDVLAALEREPDATPCERVEIANDLGWGALLANEGAGEKVVDARGPLERAVSIDGCADAYVKSFALANLARVALEDGDADAAAKRLDAARAAVKEPRGTERVAWRELEGRLLALRGRPDEALRVLDEALALARASFLLEAEWSALVARAEALEALRRDRDAITSLLEAENVLDRATLLVPLGEGRSSFAAFRSRSARALVELLVRAERVEEAARAASRSRARVLAGVERALRIERFTPTERERWESTVAAYRDARAKMDAEATADWQLAAAELARATAARAEREREVRAALERAMALLGTKLAEMEPALRPREGALDLFIHPTRHGWLAIAVDAARATAHPLPAPPADPAAVASALLDPIAARIRDKKRLRVRAHGPWRAVDVHALPFDGAPLVAKIAVDYPIGLRPSERGATPGSRALVVGDPTGDLPSARLEAEFVARRLALRSQVTSLAGANATSHAVKGWLASVDLFHYAGHGVFAGVEGWDSALPLAEGGRLTMGDVLAMAPVPRRVVLSGCDAARSDGDAEGLGLAQAFIVAGADEVVAPVRPVDDALAARLAAALYDTPADASDASLAEALRSALARLQVADTDAGVDAGIHAGAARDWAAFRVLAR